MEDNRLQAMMVLARFLFGDLSDSRGRLPFFIGIDGGDYLFSSAVYVYRVDLVIKKVSVE